MSQSAPGRMVASVTLSFCSFCADGKYPSLYHRRRFSGIDPDAIIVDDKNEILFASEACYKDT